MTYDVTDMFVNTTAGDLAADDTHCCPSEKYDPLKSFLLSYPHIPMWKFISPVIIVLGTFGNVMTIVIMRRMSEGQSSHTISPYFTALAVSDLVLLYAGLLRKWLYYMYDLFVEKLHASLCKLLPFLIYCSTMTSAWLIVSMTMQRVISVVWPHQQRLSCTKQMAVLNIAVVVAVPVTLNVHRLIANELATSSNDTDEMYYVLDEQVNSYTEIIYPWIDLVLSSIIPFCILIVGNSVLLKSVIQSVHVARVMTAGGCDQVNSRQKKASSLTLTLITVSLVFLLLSMPVCIDLIVAPYVFEDSPIAYGKLNFAYAVCNLAFYTNCAINFYLYCLTGSRFRNELKSFFYGRSPALKT